MTTGKPATSLSGIRANNSKRFTQDDPARGQRTDLRHRLVPQEQDVRKLWIGLTGGASEHHGINLDATEGILNYSDAEDTRSQSTLLPPRNGVNRRWVILGGFNTSPGQSGRRNVVRYDTPDSPALRDRRLGRGRRVGYGLTFKKDIGDFKVAGGIAYGENTTSDNAEPASSASATT